ncbi:MAG: GIY-YIG nuclease family protein [Gammaproteobacteria bacterium]|nr:GIY-YIG nuclease family protein [Gammaproteobacteria bacterium]
MADWYVYIVRCGDGSLYTGIAKDVERRVAEHNGSNLLSARYTRTRRPVELVYQEGLETRSDASRREHQIKQLTKEEKEVLINQANTTRHVPA